MEAVTGEILQKLKFSTLHDLAETLPTPLTTDAHIIQAEECYSKEKPFDAFHYLSLTHSTLLYHRMLLKLNRPQLSRDNVENTHKQEPVASNLCLMNGNQVGGNDLRIASAEETKRNLELLPSDWTVIQITSESKVGGDVRSWKKPDDPYHTPVLYFSRCRCGPNPSIIVQKIHPPKEEGSVRSILQEMELIKGENRVISKNYQNNSEKYLSKKEELNSRLRVLVRSMETGWLRLFSCLLIGGLPPNQEKEVAKRLKELLQRNQVSASEKQIAMLSLLVSYPTKGSSTTGSCLEAFSLKAGIATILQESVRSPKVKNLYPGMLELQKKIKNFRNSSRYPVVLILDKGIVSLPWEMTCGLHEQPVTRMPSLQSLIYLYLHHSKKENSLLLKGIDASNGFYILDPDGNLPRSQDRLQETFASTGWEGVQGSRPTHDHFKESLSEKDIFVYVGHGSGSQYMPAHLVENVDIRALVLLYGCSSATLVHRGAVPDPWGVVLNYLIALCPSVVGMLWDVMDKDTDLLTKEMIRALRGVQGNPGSPLEHPPTDLAHLVAKARPLCSWYLISAALVVYGLPLQVVPKVKDDDETSCH